MQVLFTTYGPRADKEKSLPAFKLKRKEEKKMENVNIAKAVATGITGIAAGIMAWLSARLGELLYVLIILAVMMIVDYISGMAASKAEAIDHPDNPEYGWNSRKGARGIFKKVGYLCIIAVAMVIDYIVIKVAKEAGIVIKAPTFFGLLATIWYVLNELLSIIENAGRMGAPIPEWLKKYISVLKNKIESTGTNNDESV